MLMACIESNDWQRNPLGQLGLLVGGASFLKIIIHNT